MVFNWTDAKVPQVKGSCSGFCVHSALTFFFPVHGRNILLRSSLFLEKESFSVLREEIALFLH